MISFTLGSCARMEVCVICAPRLMSKTSKLLKTYPVARVNLDRLERSCVWPFLTKETSCFFYQTPNMVL